jgi:hypothetical protein
MYRDSGTKNVSSSFTFAVRTVLVRHRGSCIVLLSNHTYVQYCSRVQAMSLRDLALHVLLTTASTCFALCQPTAGTFQKTYHVVPSQGVNICIKHMLFISGRLQRAHGAVSHSALLQLESADGTGCGLARTSRLRENGPTVGQRRLEVLLSSYMYRLHLLPLRAPLARAMALLSVVDTYQARKGAFNAKLRLVGMRPFFDAVGVDIHRISRRGDGDRQTIQVVDVVVATIVVHSQASSCWPSRGSVPWAGTNNKKHYRKLPA